MKTVPLTCPCDQKRPLTRIDGGYTCGSSQCPHSQAAEKFPIARDVPVLISEARTDTVCSMQDNSSFVERPMRNYARLKKWLVGQSPTTKTNCQRFITELLRTSDAPKVLVIGSADHGSGTDGLWEHPALEIHGVDIYGTHSVDVICDAHYLPLESNSYDGVWIQAVLEHLVEPQKAVAEIHRVLREKGLIYAETPFMQQVHEGAYDFTRFTVLGHRYLFKRFELIDMGGNKGPEVVFAWAVRYWVWSLSRSRRLARVFGLLTNLLVRPFSRLSSEASMFDGPSGVFFLGRKDSKFSLSHKELVTLYRGQFR